MKGGYFSSFPNYLLVDNMFKEVLDSKIRQMLSDNLPASNFKISKFSKRNSWRVYNSIIKKGKNPDVIYLEVLYKLLSMA